MGGSGWGLAPFMYGSGGWYFANAAERQKARTRLEKEREKESKRDRPDIDDAGSSRYVESKFGGV